MKALSASQNSTQSLPSPASALLSLLHSFIPFLINPPLSAGAPLLLTANTVMTLEAAEEEI